LKVDLQWVATHGLEGFDLEFERMLPFKELHCMDFGGFICEKIGRFLDIISKGKLFLLDRSAFILVFKKYFKIYLNLFIQKIFLKGLVNRISILADDLVVLSKTKG